jgi:hypothetical protein
VAPKASQQLYQTGMNIQMKYASAAPATIFSAEDIFDMSNPPD